MKVVLINPPYPDFGVSEEMQAPPLGLAYLAAVLEEHGIQSDIIDCQALGISQRELKSKLKGKTFDVAGITSQTITIKEAHKVAHSVKAVDPDSLVVMGGPHVTFTPRETLQDGNIDVVVRGEGERTLLDLVQTWSQGESLSSVEGITYRREDEIVRNPSRPLIKDLGSLPYPAWDKLPPISNYTALGTKHSSFSVLSSRGCPYRCKFCSVRKMYQGKYRERSPKNFVSELQFLHEKYGARRFSIVDDIFTINQKRTEKICELLQGRGFRWYCETRVNKVSKHLLRKMKEAGCRTIYFGVESGSQKILNRMRKGITVEQIRQAFRLCEEVGIKTVASIMLFFPGETRKTIKKTKQLVMDISPDLLQVCITTPFVGTDLYEFIEEKGWFTTKDWTHYDILTPVYELPNFSTEEMKQTWRRFYLSFYLRPTYLFRKIKAGDFTVPKTALRYISKMIKNKLGGS